ncbi:HlyD family secretion protein [Pigmentiphaga soli]|uniref:HlyD family secretion protein n=1 Tax=Pigmentiphaga soli TaxID=1007095 RepID=A0ABP8H0J3_9BURK
MSASQESLPERPAAPPPARSRRGRILLFALLAVAVVAGIAWLAHWWTVGRFIESTNDAYLKADMVTIAPKVSGYVTEVYVKDNALVAAGDPLVRLDVRQYQAALDQAAATVDSRRADIARAEAELQRQQADIEQARAQREVARANARHAAAEVQRYEPLARTGAETAEHLASLRNTLEQANATLAAQSAAVSAAERELAVGRSAVEQARAQLEVAQASLRQSQLDVGDTLVRSTIAGRIGDRSVRVGQYVQPGTRMLSVVPVHDIYLEANFKETQVGGMRPGQAATLHIDALPGVDVRGTVDSFAPGTGAQFALLPPDNATGNFTKIVQRVPVRIRVEADDRTRAVLVPGLSVTVDVDTRSAGGQDHG